MYVYCSELSRKFNGLSAFCGPAGLSLQSNVHVHDLYTDLADGRILVRFLEIISGDKLGTVGKAVFAYACTAWRPCIDDSNRKSCYGGCIGNVDSETVSVGHSLD